MPADTAVSIGAVRYQGQLSHSSNRRKKQVSLVSERQRDDPSGRRRRGLRQRPYMSALTLMPALGQRRNQLASDASLLVTTFT
jgi:hypothetical protein